MEFLNNVQNKKYYNPRRTFNIIIKNVQIQDKLIINYKKINYNSK